MYLYLISSIILNLTWSTHSLYIEAFICTWCNSLFLEFFFIPSTQRSFCFLKLPRKTISLRRFFKRKQSSHGSSTQFQKRIESFFNTSSSISFEQELKNVLLFGNYLNLHRFILSILISLKPIGSSRTSQNHNTSNISKP